MALSAGETCQVITVLAVAAVAGHDQAHLQGEYAAERHADFPTEDVLHQGVAKQTDGLSRSAIFETLVEKQVGRSRLDHTR